MLNRYDVTINGVTTTLLLSDADAAARGLDKPKAEPAQPVKAPAKARTTANKSRTPANKTA